MQRDILSFCAAERLRCLDILPVLRPAGESAFVDYDHLSPSGARLVAATLAASDLFERGNSSGDVLRKAPRPSPPQRPCSGLASAVGGRRVGRG